MSGNALRAGLWAALLLGCFVTAGPLNAQETEPPPVAESTETETPTAAAEEPADEEAADTSSTEDELVGEAGAAVTTGDFSAADNAWVLVSSALVLMMTAPGLALFYSGLVRKKNVLGVMMQCIFLMGMMTVIWAVYGYSLAFGSPENPFIGNFDYAFMRGVQKEFGQDTPQVGSITRLSHMLFQGMFFIITPALICGAFAERMKFSTMVVFSALWGTLVYCPLCHWVWGEGILMYGYPNSQRFGTGALDFAGGTVVHISSGVSALVCAIVMGKRLGWGSQPMPPHNLTYTTIGAAMLWVGWFGFNAGSALAANDVASSAFAATHFAAAAGTLAWAGMEWITRGKPSVLGACSGAVAGLVCITPGAGHVQPIWAIVMGLAGGITCYFACTTLKTKLGYDDSLDAFGVHGVGGTLGAILTGVFATRAVWDVNSTGKELGLIEGGTVIFAQLKATALTWFVAAAATFVLLKVLDLVMGLRVSQQDEMQGLDLSQHGEEGYIFL
jgi:Amt family ammonium transporter